MKTKSRDIRATGRELQVLELAASGNTDKQIALQLEISKETVASYWRRILLKYDANSRTEVVARHAEQRIMAMIQDSSKEDERLADEVTSRTLAQAKELAQRNLLQAITECSLEYISGRKHFREVFERFLAEILALTQSEYGFLAEVLLDENGAPYLKTHAITNISWNRETRELYDRYYFDGLEFRNLKTLFGHSLTTGEIVIANNPKTDPRRGGLPPGHPPMPAFLGIPVFSGEDLVGMIGLANRPGGYDREFVDYLKPLVATCANFIIGLRAEHARQMIEQQLADSATLIRTLTDALPTAVLFEDCDRSLQFVNRSFLSIFGAEANPDDLIGMNCGAVAEGSRQLFADPEGFLQRVDELLSGDEDHMGDLVQMADGRLYERDFVVVRQGPAKLGYLWKYRDVTSWRSELETLIGVFQLAMDAVIVIDADGRVEFWNGKAEEIFGFSAEEAEGKCLTDLIIPPEMHEAHRAGLKRYRETRQGRVMNQFIRIEGMHKSKERFEVDLSIACVSSGPEPRFSAFIRKVNPGNFL